MGAIQSIRKKGNLLIATIGVSLLFFILSQGIRGIIPLLTKREDYVGEIAGHKIKFYVYNKMLNNFKSNYIKRRDKTMTEANINDSVWNHTKKEYIEKYMLEREYEKLGLIVSPEEKVDLVQGRYIHPYIKQLFVDKDGNFNKSKLLEFLELMPNRSREEQMQFYYIEDRIEKDALYQKLLTMLSGTVYMTDAELENKRLYEYSELDLKLIFIPYESITYDGTNVSDDDLKVYLNENKDKYQVNKNLDIIYAEFPIKPSQEDENNFFIELEDLSIKFKEAKDSIIFAKKSTEGSENDIEYIYTYKTLRKLFPNIKKFKKNTVIGPQKQEENIYKIYKIYKIKKSKKSLEYYVSVIEKKLTASDKTKNQIYRQVEKISSNIKSEKRLKEARDRSNFVLKTATQITENSDNIDDLENAREIVRWLFKKQNKNKVSPVFEIGDKFIFALPIKYNKAGLVDLQYVKEEIKDEVIKQKKFEIIKKNISISKEKYLNEIAEEYGKNAKVFTLKDIKFKDSTLSKIGEVSKAIGKAFALKNTGDRTDLFLENNGALLVELIERRDSPIENNQQHKDAANISEGVMERLNVYLAFEDRSKIKDYRYKFY